MSFPSCRTCRRFAVRESPMKMVFFFFPCMTVVTACASTALVSVTANAGTAMAMNMTMVITTAVKWSQSLFFTLISFLPNSFQSGAPEIYTYFR